MLIETIVSGGQTGADRAALEFALAAGISIRGWIPKGRRAEDGAISTQYAGLVECDSEDPAVRTALNVRDSGGTVALSHGPLTGGTALAATEAKRLGRPLLHLDLAQLDICSAAERLRSWLVEHDVRVLNVPGPRHSDDELIFARTMHVLTLAIPRDNDVPENCN
jgi:hypothetical protein